MSVAHRRRLRLLWESAGWPSHDALDLDLLAAGLVERCVDAAGRETLRVSDEGVRLLVTTRAGHQRARGAHEALVARVAEEMVRAGRVTWRGLVLRAPLDDVQVGPDGRTRQRTRWAMAMPDVFSIRHTSVEDHVEPVAHEVKVHRADLLSDLKRPSKGGAYRALCSECWYVIRAGIAQADEIPPVYGVLAAHPRADADHDGAAFGRLEVLRPAPRRPYRVPFTVWMALARAVPEQAASLDAQAPLTVVDAGALPRGAPSSPP